MRSVLLALTLIACGESSTSSLASADAATDAEAPGYDCCVDGRRCTSGEQVRWCAPPDAGPPGQGCKLSALVACYMRTTDAGVEEVYRMNYIAPKETWPDGISECSAEVSTSYDAAGRCP